MNIRRFAICMAWMQLKRVTLSDRHGILPGYIQGGRGPKNRTCLSVDNSAVVSGRKTCDTSKVSECCKE